MDISRGLTYTPQSLPIDKQQQKIQYYSPFDDLFGLAALLKPSGCDSLSESPNSDRSCWREHERERSESDEGSVFGSDKDPSSPTAYLTGFKPLDSPTFYSQREFDFQIPLDDIQNRSHNQRLHSVPISKSRQPLMTITYDDFLKSIDTIGPLINSGAGMGANHSPAQQPSATRFDATSLLGRSNSVSVGVTVLEKKGSARYCVFCKNNGEEEHFYNGHVLKSDNGIIVCPVLRAYQCPICHASGDYAHTIKYCPLGKGNEHDWLNSRSGSGRNSRLASNKV